MKKLIVILILLLSLTGCSDKKEESKLDSNSEIVVETIQVEEIRIEEITIE